MKITEKIDRYLSESIEDEEETEETGEDEKPKVDLTGVEDYKGYPTWNVDIFDSVGRHWPDPEDICNKFGDEPDAAGRRKAEKVLQYVWDSIQENIGYTIPDEFEHILGFKVKLDYTGGWVYVKNWKMVEDFEKVDVVKYFKIEQTLDDMKNGFDDSSYVYDMIEANQWMDND